MNHVLPWMGAALALALSVILSAWVDHWWTRPHGRHGLSLAERRARGCPDCGRRDGHWSGCLRRSWG